MKVNELKNEYPINRKVTAATRALLKKPISDTWYGEIQCMKPFHQKMAEMGWTKVVTMGGYSDVFIKPNEPYVLKINKRPDEAFAHFADIAMAYPNIHFPKIGNVRQITYDNRIYYIYAIEKLNNIANEGEAIEISMFCSNFVGGEHIKDSWWAPQMVQQLTRHFPKFAGQEKSLLVALNLLRRNRADYRIDIHFNNIMKRDETIVIIDPFEVN